MKNYLKTIILFTALAAPLIASATALTNPLGTTDISVFVGNLIKAILGLSGVAAFAMFVWGGVQWIISGGSKEKVESGKKTLIWATFGLIFIFISYALLYTLLTIVGQASAGA